MSARNLILAGTLLLAGCVSDYGAADAERRSISLFHKPSGESLTEQYVVDGRYNATAIKRIQHILRDRREDSVGRIDPKLIDFIADLRDRVGLPESAALEVVDGYRTSESNALYRKANPKVARESWHMRGRAVDLRVPDLTGQAMAEVAKTMQRGGVAWYPKSGHVHIDTGEIRTWDVK